MAARILDHTTMTQTLRMELLSFVVTGVQTSIARLVGGPSQLVIAVTCIATMRPSLSCLCIVMRQLGKESRTLDFGVTRNLRILDLKVVNNIQC